MKRFVAIGLLSILLLSVAISRICAQSSLTSVTISREDWLQSQVDLATVKAQMLAYSQALALVTQERDSLKSQLDSHSTDSAQSSQQQTAEVRAQTKRLDDLNSTINGLETSLDTVTKTYQAQLDKMDKDHKSEITKYQLGDLVRDVIIVILGLIAVDDAGHRLKIW